MYTSCTASLVRLRPVEYKAIVGHVKTTRTRSQFTGYLNKNMTGYVKQDVQDHKFGKDRFWISYVQDIKNMTGSPVG